MRDSNFVLSKHLSISPIISQHTLTITFSWNPSKHTKYWFLMIKSSMCHTPYHVALTILWQSHSLGAPTQHTMLVSLVEAFDVPCSSNIIEDSQFVLKTHQILVLFNFLDRHATLTIYWQPYPHRNPVRANKNLVQWDCFLDVPRPYQLGTRFAFCAEDKLIYRSGSFLRCAYYPHHTLTVQLPRDPSPYTKYWSLGWGLRCVTPNKLWCKIRIFKILISRSHRFLRCAC